MKLPRAIAFGILLYAASFVMYVAVTALFGIGMGFADLPTLLMYVVAWILYIPLVLFLAKWYFRKDPPTVKKGFWLGVIAIGVAAVGDLIFVLPFFAGENTQLFYAHFASWEFYMTVAWIIGLATFAGWEFDKTFTKHESKHE